MYRRIAAALFCASIVMLSVGLMRDHHAYAQQNSPTPATILAGPLTPTAAGLVCGPGMASVSSSSLYNMTGLTGNTLFKCATSDGITYAWQAPYVAATPTILGTTATIGGSLMALNSSVTGTGTVTGATVGQNCLATPSDGTFPPAGIQVACAISASNTATVRLTALISATPAAVVYNIRVLP